MHKISRTALAPLWWRSWLLLAALFLSKRAEVKELIRSLRERSPYIEMNIFRSVENVNVNTVIAYKKDGVRHHFLDEYDIK